MIAERDGLCGRIRPKGGLSAKLRGRSIELPTTLMLIALVLALSGCATFDDYPGDPPTSHEGFGGAARPELSLAIRLASSLDGVTWHSQDVSRAPDWISDVFLESGAFSAVRPPEVESPQRASLVIERFSGPLTGGLLSIASGFLIPGVQHRGIRVTLRLGVLGEPPVVARREHRFRVWVEVFLLPFYFTHGPALSANRFTERMVRDCVYEALEKLGAATHRQS